MPFELTLRLQLVGGSGPTGFSGGDTRWAVLNLIRTVAPDASAGLHDSHSRHLTVSSLLGCEDQAACPDIALLRLTGLDDQLLGVLVDAFGSAATIRVGNSRWELTTEEAHELVSVSYEELLKTAEPMGRARIVFTSPTSFKTQPREKRDVVWPLPDPEHCFQSWLMAWEAGGPSLGVQRERLLEEVRAAVAIAELKGGTERVPLNGHPEIGFVGTVVFTVLAPVPEPIDRILDCLVRFSTYCGTGRKTPQGLGQTYVLERSAARRNGGKRA